MVVDVNYWTKVLKRLIILGITVLFIFLLFKLSIFYMPFLIAFIISLMIEPVIRFMMKKTKLRRRTSSIIVITGVILIILGLLIWGIISLISESTNLLQDLNSYFEKAYNQFQNFISNLDMDKIKVPDKVLEILQSTTADALGAISNIAKNILTKIINIITSVPTIGIYIGITFISIYFICIDRIYMMDQLEHHLPKIWVRKIGKHLREIIKTLGGYLKAEATLVIISFVVSLVGLYIFKFMGLNIEFPLLAALRNRFCRCFANIWFSNCYDSMGDNSRIRRRYNFRICYFRFININEYYKTIFRTKNNWK